MDGSGTLGFLVCWYLAFLLIYASVVAHVEPRHIVVDRLVTAALYAAAGSSSSRSVARWSTRSPRAGTPSSTSNFFTQDMSGVSPTAPLNQGGILHAIVGTVIEVGIAVAVSVPLGIGTAVYMTEVGGRGSRSCGPSSRR